MELQIFELTPINGRKSFHGKCKVIIQDEYAKLLSYNTIVAEYDIITKDYKQHIEKPSLTTNSHIKAFKQFYEIQ
jgi:hypothetical protein